jgi:hypothetical protein
MSLLKDLMALFGTPKGQPRDGYVPLLANEPGDPEIADLSPQDYERLKEKTIRIIQSLPTAYLPKDRADAAVSAMRAGR